MVQKTPPTNFQNDKHAYSGHRERPIRSIVNTDSGDHEHPIALA
jgi:hypothetical protein